MGSNIDRAEPVLRLSKRGERKKANNRAQTSWGNAIEREKRGKCMSKEPMLRRMNFRRRFMNFSPHYQASSSVQSRHGMMSEDGHRGITHSSIPCLYSTLFAQVMPFARRSVESIRKVTPTSAAVTCLRKGSAPGAQPATRIYPSTIRTSCIHTVEGARRGQGPEEGSVISPV